MASEQPEHDICYNEGSSVGYSNISYSNIEFVSMDGLIQLVRCEAHLKEDGY